MKTLIFTPVIFLAFLLSYSFGISYISVADGDWTTPTTWDPVGVPIPGDDITIDTDVILNSNFYYTAGSVTINEDASLTEDVAGRSFTVNGGTFENNGVLRITYLVTIGGTTENNDSIYIYVSFLNSSTFDNNGVIAEADSFLNEGAYNNNADAEILVSNFYNNYNIDNFGVIDATNFYNAGTIPNSGEMWFTNFTNTGSFVNDGEIESNDFRNTGTFHNFSYITGTNDFTNVGTFEMFADSEFEIENNFLNCDSANHTALFINNGLVEVGHHWANTDTVKGFAGEFYVEDSTFNFGWMKGSFDFCDLTPPATEPYIDYNSGTIDPDITYCQDPVNDLEGSAFISIYPNPARNTLYIESGNTGPETIKLYDIIGNLISSHEQANSINTSELQKGIYFVEFIDKNGNIIMREKLIKE